MAYKYKVAVIDDWSKLAADCAVWKLLDPYCSKIDFYHDDINDLEENMNRLYSYDIIVCMRNRTKFEQSLLSKLPNLKLLTSTGGRNLCIDTEYAISKGITVCVSDHPSKGNLKNTTNWNYMPTSELVWAYILNYFRKINTRTNELKTNKLSWYPMGIKNQSQSLSGLNIGIIGIGSIGGNVAKIALLFGMNVIGWSIHLTQEKCNKIDKRITCCKSLNDLLIQSDIIIISIVLSEKTKYLICKKELKMMKKNVLLINVSRGDIINEDDLIYALDNNWINSVGLDVFHKEPLPINHPFRDKQRFDDNKVMLTSHQGGFVQRVYKLWYTNSVENILAFIHKTPIRVIKHRYQRGTANQNELKIADRLYTSKL